MRINGLSTFLPDSSDFPGSYFGPGLQQASRLLYEKFTSSERPGLHSARLSLVPQLSHTDRKNRHSRHQERLSLANILDELQIASAMGNELTPQEMSLLKSLNRPEKIQHFLDEQVAYNKEVTCRSPRRVLRDRVAHCAEGAFLAAAALRANGNAPIIIDLITVRDDDHLLTVFQEDGRWGAIGKSNYAGLRYREPVYRTLRELVMSYYEHYFNLDGEKTLRGYSRPVNLTRFDSIHWMTTEEDLWPICEYLCTIPHTRVLTPAIERRRRSEDARLFAAGHVGAV